MHVRNLGYHFLRQIGGPKPTFLAISQLKGNFNGLYLRKNRIYIRGKCVANYKGSVTYIVSEQHELWSTNGFKLDHSFYPPSVNSAFHSIVRLRLRRSANGTQPHFVRRWTVGRANNVPQKSWGRPFRKNGGQKLLYLVGFSTTSRLNGEYLLN